MKRDNAELVATTKGEIALREVQRSLALRWVAAKIIPVVGTNTT